MNSMCTNTITSQHITITETENDNEFMNIPIPPILGELLTATNAYQGIWS
jgi:hypothetical protein